MDVGGRDVVELLDRYGIAILLAVDAALFAVAVSLWKPGSKPLAMGIGVFALIVPLSILAVALDGVS